jgi:succinoglycan biosynthesis transport protein ExoP
MGTRKPITPEDHELRVRSAALGKRKSIILVIFVLALIAAGAGFLVPVPYKAQSRLHVAAVPPKVLFQTGDNGGGDYLQYQNTQKSLVKSRLVLSAALRDPKVGRYQMVREQIDPIAWLQEKLKVEFIGGSEVMEISLAGGKPEEVAGLVNAVVRAYIDEVVNWDLKRRTERFDRLRKIKDQYADLLKKKRDTVRKLSEAAGLDDLPPDREKDALYRLYYDLRSRIVQLRLEQVEVETLLSRRKKGEGDVADPAPREVAQLGDRLAVLKASQVALDEQIQHLAPELRRTSTHSLDLQSNKDEIAQLEEASRKVAAEVEALTIELEAPPRIRLIDEAVAPRL